MNTALIAERTATVAINLAYYAKRPGRAGELVRWARLRGATTISARQPWWSFAAVDAVAEAVRPGTKVLEYGGGGSTLWMADRGAEVTVVEDDASWAEVLRGHLGEGASVLLREPEDVGTIASSVYPGKFFDSYVGAAAELADDSLDMVVVDGRARVACGLAAMPKVRQSGMLLLDDSDRPKYAELCSALSGWDRHDYDGVRASGGRPTQTSIWTRPVQA